MKELPIRKFTSVVSYLTEAVLITRDGAAIGVYTPVLEPEIREGPAPMEDPPTIVNLGQITHEQFLEVKKSMEEPVKKAIEAEEVKSTPRGQLRKGLGEIPGDPTATKPEKHYPMGTFGGPTPAPKPGKK